MKDIYIINERTVAAIYGIGTFIREYVKCLRCPDVRINLIELNSQKESFSIEEKDGIRKYIFPYVSDQRDKNYRSVSRLLRFFISDSSDLVFHLNYLHSEVLVDQLRKYFPSSKVILSIHYLEWTWALDGDTALFKKIIERKSRKMTHNRYNNIIEIYDRNIRLFNKVDSVICLSMDSYDIVRNVYKIKKPSIYLIPNGLKDKYRKLSMKEQLDIRETLHLSGSEKIILFVGRLDKIKGIYSLIRSFKNVIKSEPNCKLAIIGAAGDFVSAIQCCKDIWSKIIFTGNLSTKELSRWYQIADLAVFPSFSEECSYVGIEMMMYGLPIVASNGRCISDMFNNTNSFVVDIGERKNIQIFEEKLQKAISLLISSDSFRTDLRLKARDSYKENYNSSIMCQRYRDILFSI